MHATSNVLGIKESREIGGLGAREGCRVEGVIVPSAVLPMPNSMRGCDPGDFLPGEVPRKISSAIPCAKLQAPYQHSPIKHEAPDIPTPLLRGNCTVLILKAPLTSETLPIVATRSR